MGAEGSSSRPQDEWSDEEKWLLQREAFLAEIVRLRTQSSQSAKPKPRWLQFLESNGGTALIATVLGAVLVQWVSGSIQGRLREKEFQQTLTATRENQALVQYKEDLVQEEQILKRAYELIGGEIQAAEDLIELTSPGLSLKAYEGRELKKIQDQRDRIRTAYNKADIEWRSQKVDFSLLIVLYHHGQSSIMSGWQDTQSSVDAYMDCALKWYEVHETASEDVLEGACANERNVLIGNLGRLAEALNSARSKGR